MIATLWKQLSCAGWLLLAWAIFAAPTGMADPSADGGLKVLVFGASGKVGSHVLDEALNRGHRVTAVSREPSKVSRVNDRLLVSRGDVLDPGSVAGLVADQDVVIVSVRGVAGNSKDPADAVPLLAVKNVVNVMRAMGKEAPRLIHVGGAGSLEIAPGVLLADRLPGFLMPKNLELEIAGQVLALEYLRGVADVDWTYATPPRSFTSGKRTGHFRIGGDRLMEDAQGRSRVSRTDFAVAVINEAENPQYIQQRFSVAY